MRFCLACICLLCITGLSLQGQTDFPYPDVPDSLSSKESRIDYLAIHFWDKVDFGNEEILATSKPVLNYIYLLQNSKGVSSQGCLKRLFDLTAEYDEFVGSLLSWFSHFLHDAHSPLYDDLFYSAILNTALESKVSDDIRNNILSQLKIVDQNQPGQAANNFGFDDKLGNRHMLYDIKAKYLLLVFTNPDCSVCKKTEEAMGSSEMLNSLINKGIVMVLAVCPEDNYEGWLSHAYPQTWINGYDMARELYSNRLYDIQYYPSLYLLDSNKTVLVKESDWQIVELYFKEAISAL